MLTDSQCRTAKCKDKPYKLSDTKGLYLQGQAQRGESLALPFQADQGRRDEGERVRHRRLCLRAAR